MNKKAYKEIFVFNRTGNGIIRPTPFHTQVFSQNRRVERYDNMLDSIEVMKRAITKMSICHLK